MIDSIMDFITGHGKLFAWISGFIVVFISTVSLYMLISLPVILLVDKYTSTTAFSGAIGCGLGTAFVNAFIIAKNA